MSQKYNLTNLPGSGSFQKKTLDIRSIKGRILSREYVHYVIGICGGDCAGKKELINYMFTSDQDGVWLGNDSK